MNTKDVLEAVQKFNLQRYLEIDRDEKVIKIPVSSFPMFPSKIADSLNSLKKTSTTFGGLLGRKVIKI